MGCVRCRPVSYSLHTCKLLSPRHNVLAVHSLMVSVYAGNLESEEAGAGECPHCDGVLAERLINWTQPGRLLWQITANEKINSTRVVSMIFIYLPFCLLWMEIRNKL